MPTSKDEAYTYIKNKIVTCEYKPNQVLDLNEIQNALGVSRTPVRDAIAALEQENLVTVLPRRGVLVTAITPKEIADIYAVREVLEPFIAHRAAQMADPEKLQYFRDKFTDSSLSVAELNRYDQDFHWYLVTVVNNPYLTSIMNLILSHNMRFIVLGGRIPKRIDISNQEHLKIIDALLARDSDKAEKLMRQHMSKAAESAYMSMSLSNG